MQVHLKLVLVVKTSVSECVRVGALVSMQGKVVLKRKEWLNYRPTDVGTVLCRGDLLQPLKGTKAIVQCAESELSYWVVPDGIPSGAAMGCRSPDKLLHTITGPITPTRD